MKKILLIEDNEDIREMTAELLAMSNFEVIQAENGKIGVEKALQNMPDIVICDIMMPVLDGFGVLHIFHQNEKLLNIPFIFLTAKTDRVDFRKGMEMGADDYITKPFSEIELLNAIETRLKRKEQLHNMGEHATEQLSLLIDEAKATEHLNGLLIDKKPHNYKKKQLIYTEGDAATKVYFIKNGKVKTFQTNEYGKNYTTAIFDKGQYFGHLAMIEDRAHVENAEAIEDCELISIAKPEFMDLLYKNPHVSAKFIKLLANEVVLKEQMLASMAYNSLRKRIAETLVSLHAKFHGDDQTINIKISREELASLVGTATESLIRTLSEFKHDKLIDLRGSEISILNLEKLSRLRA